MSNEVTVEAPVVPPPKMQVRLMARGMTAQFEVPEEYFAELLEWLFDHYAHEEGS